MKGLFILIICMGLASKVAAQDNVRCGFSGWQSKRSAGQLPYLKAFSVEVIDNKIHVSWIAGELRAGGAYIVERAVNGQDFRQVAEKRVNAVSLPLDIAFSFTDSGVGGLVRYRLIYIASDGSRIEYETVCVEIPGRGLREKLL